MTVFYKATRPNGRDFRTGTVDYGAALTSGEVVKHPLDLKLKDRQASSASAYLSVASVPTDCTGLSWPCRLFEVEPVGRHWTPAPSAMPNKRACHSLRVIREVESWRVFGPQGKQIAALIDAAGRLTAQQVRALDAALGAAWDAALGAALGAAWDAALGAALGAARDAAWDAALGAARDAAWDAALGAARDAAWGAGGLLVRDLVGTANGPSQAQYDLLTRAWREVVGPLHEDDVDLRKVSA